MTTIERRPSSGSGSWAPRSGELGSRRASMDSGIMSPTSSGFSTPDNMRSVQNSPGMEGSRKAAFTYVQNIKPLPFGPEGGLTRRVGLTTSDGTRMLSPWHDVQLFWPDGLLSCVCKSPAGTWLRYEVAVSEPSHPFRLTRGPGFIRDIMQRQMESRSYKSPKSRGWQRARMLMMQSLRPAHFVDDTPWNIGMLPQTWGNTGKLGCASRSTPDGTLGVVDIGHAKIRRTGEVYLLKPLGAFSVQSEEGGEMSWKILAIDIEDPMAELLKDASDIQSLLPGMMEQLTEWLETHLGIRPGIPGRFMIKGPYHLSTAVNKIRDHHKAWQQSRTHPLGQPQLPLLQSGKKLTPELLEDAWNQLTLKDKKSILGPVSVSNPDSIMLHDHSWFGDMEEEEEELLVEILGMEEEEPVQNAPAPVREPAPKVAAPQPPPPVAAQVPQKVKLGSTSPPPAPVTAVKPTVNLNVSQRETVSAKSPDSVLPSSNGRVSAASASKPPTHSGAPAAASGNANARAGKKEKSGFSNFWFQWRRKSKYTSQYS